MGDHGGSEGGGGGGGGRGSHVKEAGGAAPPGADGRTDKLVNARWGSSPQAQSTGALGSPGGRETAGQHRWVEHLSEDTNQVDMVKAMAHRAGEGQAKYSKKKTRTGSRGWRSGGERYTTATVRAGGSDWSQSHIWGGSEL